MKTLVAYMSKTGNTRKVAKAIYGEIPGEKEIKPIAEVTSLAGYDVAFLGFPVMGEGPDTKARAFLAANCTPDSNIVLFVTHASPEDAPELEGTLDKFRAATGQANIVDVFDCQGQLARPIKLFMSIMPNAKYRRWAKQDRSQGQPDEAALARARAFARCVTLRVHEALGEQPEPVLVS